MCKVLIVILLVSIFSCKDASVKTTDKPIQALEKEISSAPKKSMSVPTLDLTEYGIANSNANVLGGLSVGAVAPDFNLIDNNGDAVQLYEILAHGSVLLNFYRAHWCPYCSKHMVELEALSDEFKSKGIQVYGISPEKPSYANQMINEHNLTIPVLYDADHQVMKDYKCFFQVTDAYQAKVTKFLSMDIKEVNNDTVAVLPVPATYLIGRDRKIEYVFYNNDYSQRADFDLMLGHK